MARSHHRKKHKTQLRQYHHTHDGETSKVRKRKVTSTMTVIGIIVGVAVGYFGSDGMPLWIGIGAVIGGIAGYITGFFLDKDGRS